MAIKVTKQPENIITMFSTEVANGKTEGGRKFSVSQVPNGNIEIHFYDPMETYKVTLESIVNTIFEEIDLS